MARKLAVLTVLLSVMFMAASAYKTTVTAVVEEDDDQNLVSRREGSRQQCREQIQRQQNLVHCQQFLARGGRLIKLGMRGAGDANSEQLQECCRQLRQVDNNHATVNYPKTKFPIPTLDNYPFRAESLLLILWIEFMYTGGGALQVPGDRGDPAGTAAAGEAAGPEAEGGDPDGGEPAQHVQAEPSELRNRRPWWLRP